MTSLNIGLEELDKYNRIGIAFSGGLDSSVLLHLLGKLKFIQIKVNDLTYKSRCQQTISKVGEIL